MDKIEMAKEVAVWWASQPWSRELDASLKRLYGKDGFRQILYERKELRMKEYADTIWWDNAHKRYMAGKRIR